MSFEKNIFEVATAPLNRAVHLVEASAGTGKTYAIAMLVLRLVAEQGLKIEEILVVTFTRAATEELGERIRARLVDGRNILAGQVSGADDTLKCWSKSVVDADLANTRIKEALIDIDRANIYTIHGFCQRMLQEQALESGQLFDVELKPDNSLTHQRIMQDFWRLHVYSLSKDQAGIILSHFSSPEELHESVSPLAVHLDRVEPDNLEFKSAAEKYALHFNSLTKWFSNEGIELYDVLAELIDEGKMKKKFGTEFQNWWQAIDLYLSKKSHIPPAELGYLVPENFLEQINGNKVRGEKKQELLNSIPLPGQELEGLLQGIDEMVLSFRQSYVAFFLEESAKQMAEANSMSYDDLILRFHHAVKNPAGSSLISLLRHRFQAAVIDEFQDTDAMQWQIFNTLFAGKRHFLYLIGDPKQAIYKFRGADIHSYFKAKEAANHHLTLRKNYRSHPGSVAIFNSLFSGREKPFFFDESMLDFSPVEAALTVEDYSLTSPGKTLENVVFCQLERSGKKKDGSWTVAGAADAIMHYVVNETVALLGGGFEYTFKGENGSERRPLQPGDIAILVRQNDQAEQYQAMLARAGVAAVLTSKTSVFQTAECNELSTVLKAIAHPDDINRLKSAMTVSWFGHCGDELYRIWQDDALFNPFYSRFQEYAEIWQNFGISLMMKRFLKGEKILETLVLGERAERKIANIYQLIELLQDAVDENMYGPEQLLLWLRRKMENPTGEYELRLDRDDDAVQILTMHGAKGLEFPVVFCPYLWYRKTLLEKEKNRISCYENDNYILDLGSRHFERRRENMLQEEMAEDLRLCYVALTRAKVRCYMIWCDYQGRKGSTADSFSSGLGYLLFPQGRLDFVTQQQILKDKGNEEAGGYHLIEAEPDNVSYHQADQADSVEFECRKSARLPVYAERQMTSYSALVSTSAHESSSLEEIEPVSQPVIRLDEELERKTPFADLPAGANFGNVVHDILESQSFTSLLKPEEIREPVIQTCRKYGVEADVDLLMSLLEVTVSTSLQQNGVAENETLSLARIEAKKCVKEMGFYFHLQRGDTRDINRIFSDEQTIGAIGEKQLAGFLTGFVDLIFEHNGKFYIADYKTNHLGDTYADYGADSLVHAMAVHNYGLQYYLYTLVIHRYLQNFFPVYDYGEHFGGVFYLFLRGMDGWGKGVYYDKPDLEKLERLNNCFLGSGS